MTVKISEITVAYGGWEEGHFLLYPSSTPNPLRGLYRPPRWRRVWNYCVMYPVPAPHRSPAWLLLDADGKAVCSSQTIDTLRDFAPEEFVDTLEAAAQAVVAHGDGEPLEGRGEPLTARGREWAERLGWVPAADSAAAGG